MSMKFSPDEIYERLISAGSEWAEAQYLADQLEEMKKPVLNQLKLASPEKSDTAKETWAYAQQEYASHVAGMTMARKNANLKKVRWIAAQDWVDAKRTEQSNLRAEMTMR